MVDEIRQVLRDVFERIGELGGSLDAVVAWCEEMGIDYAALKEFCEDDMLQHELRGGRPMGAAAAMVVGFQIGFAVRAAREEART